MGIKSRLDKHMVGCSILLWKINLLKQSLHVSMHAGWDQFPYDVAGIMKNPGYRQSVVQADDLPGLDAALTTIRKGRSSSVVFRITSCDNLTYWCLLAGRAQEGAADAIYGSLVCIEDRLIKQLDMESPVSADRPFEGQTGDDVAVSTAELVGLKRALSGHRDLHGRLEALCEWNEGQLFEAVLFSDVKQDIGRVEVHRAGAAVAELPQGKSYPYDGTIAEMIVSLDLRYMVVEDTMESLKPIDWALFVPHGIRSYFAVPCFEQGQIRSVLIFCSREASEFSMDQEYFFHKVSEMFMDGLQA
ncbi:hypothetical protein [Pseudovibrio exalbescens]|nr:hypothetical protein [Pseudovibrio exalbescens]